MTSAGDSKRARTPDQTDGEDSREAKAARIEANGVGTSPQAAASQPEPPAARDSTTEAAVATPSQPQQQSAADAKAEASATPPPVLSTTRAKSEDPLIPNDTASIRLCVAVSEDKGARQTMEDVVAINLDGRGGAAELGQARVSFIGVFDGHGGSSCAEMAAEALHTRTMQAGLAKVVATAMSGSKKVDVKAAKAAIAEGYKLTDEAVLAEAKAKGWQDGACAVTVWVLENTVLVANVGDSKAVLARTADKAGPGFAAGALRGLLISKDHLAIYPAERTRIEKAGGFVGKAGCSSQPDIAAFELTPRDKFMLLGCDGFWGVFDAQGAVDMAAALLAEGRDEKAVTNRLLNAAVRERGCRDNCTVLLINFRTQGAGNPAKGTS